MEQSIEKLIVSRVVKKFPACHQFSLSQLNPIHSLHSISLIYSLMLSIYA